MKGEKDEVLYLDLIGGPRLSHLIGSESSNSSEKALLLKMGSESSEKIANSIKISRKVVKKMIKPVNVKYFLKLGVLFKTQIFFQFGMFSKINLIY